MTNSKNNLGFSLVELLVALAITGIVATAVFSVFKSQSDSYQVQGQILEMQQNLRASLDIITGDIRMAGYNLNGVTDAIETGSIDFDNDGTEDLVSNNNPSLGGTDALSLKMFTGRPIPVVKHTAAAANLSVCDSGDLQVGDKLLAVDVSTAQYQFLQITNIQSPNCATECGGPCNKIVFNSGLSDFNSAGGLGSSYLDGTIGRFSAVTYYIEPDSNADGSADDPALMRSEDFGAPEVVASGIEDMQVVYLDADDNPTSTPADIRRVRLTLLARSRNPLDNFGVAGSTRPAIEDHAAAVAADSYKRRRLTRLITCRNLGL